MGIYRSGSVNIHRYSPTLRRIILLLMTLAGLLISGRSSGGWRANADIQLRPCGLRTLQCSCGRWHQVPWGRVRRCCAVVTTASILVVWRALHSRLSFAACEWTNYFVNVWIVSLVASHWLELICVRNFTIWLLHSLQFSTVRYSLVQHSSVRYSTV